MLNSVMLGDNDLERVYFVNVAGEGGLGVVELGLECCENGRGGRCGLLG